MRVPPYVNIPGDLPVHALFNSLVCSVAVRKKKEKSNHILVLEKFLFYLID